MEKGSDANHNGILSFDEENQDSEDNKEYLERSADMTIVDDPSIAKEPEEVDEFSEDDLHEVHVDEITAKIIKDHEKE